RSEVSRRDRNSGSGRDQWPPPQTPLPGAVIVSLITVTPFSFVTVSLDRRVPWDVGTPSGRLTPLWQPTRLGEPVIWDLLKSITTVNGVDVKVPGALIVDVASTAVLPAPHVPARSVPSEMRIDSNVPVAGVVSVVLVKFVPVTASVLAEPPPVPKTSLT